MTTSTIAEQIQILESRLEKYREMEMKILECGESYSISDRSKTNPRLETIQKVIRRLENQCERLRNGGGIAVKFGVPRN